MGCVVAEKQGPHGLLLVITDKELLGKTFEEKMDEIARTTMRGRFVEPEEIAAFVAFLLSEDGNGLNGGVYDIK